MAPNGIKSKKSDSEVQQQNPETAQEAEAGSAPAAASEQPTAPLNGQPPQLTPEARAKLAEIRSRIETSVGQVTLLMMQLPRYRHHTLADLNHLVIEPLLRDRIAIAYAKGEGDQQALNPAPVGVAIWASVSDEAEAKIKEQIKAGAFPVRLAPDEWSSGDKVWLIDVLGISRNAASAVLLNFKQIAGERDVRMHPIVAGTVDPELLSNLKKS